MGSFKFALGKGRGVGSHSHPGAHGRKDERCELPPESAAQRRGGYAAPPLELTPRGAGTLGSAATA